MNLFTLYATLGLDAKDFDNGVQKASRQGKGLASDLKDSVGGAAGYVGQKTSAMTIAMGHALYDMGKAAVKGAAELGKAVISEYAQTEQLVGGVNKMFGDDANLVIDNANNAFKTAGLSANEYMETVTSFSATLLKGLGGDTQKAAEFADMAVQDMADNANTFGTDMASIQNAYQGFAKQNYTMLDNLKLGYGGTKTEMQRLLKDARKIQKEQGINKKYSIDNFNDIIEAIHVVQENLGVAGTTANEAQDTISGSFNAFKASWKNWLSGLANGEANVEDLTNNLVDTGKTALQNIEKVVPTIVSSVTTALSVLGPTALDVGADVLAQLYTGLTGDETSAEAIKTYIGGVFGGAKTKITDVIDVGKTFFGGFLEGLNGDSASETNIITKIGGLFDNFMSAKDAFINLGGTILGSFYETLSGQEATADNIGKTLGGLFDAGVTGASDLLAINETFMRDLAAAINGDPQAVAEGKAGVEGVFKAAGTAMEGVIESSGSFLANCYKAITGDKATAEKIRKFFTFEDEPDVSGLLPEYAEEKDEYELKQRIKLNNKAQEKGLGGWVTPEMIANTMFGDGSDRAQANNAANQYTSTATAELTYEDFLRTATEYITKRYGNDYEIVDNADVMRIIQELAGEGDTSAYDLLEKLGEVTEYNEQRADEDSSAAEATSESAQQLNFAAAALQQAAAALAGALSGVKVELNGETVGEVVANMASEMISRSIRQKIKGVTLGGV